MKPITVFLKVKNIKTQKVVLHLCMIWKDKAKIRKLMPFFLRDKYMIDSRDHEVIYYDFWVEDEQLLINVVMASVCFNSQTAF